jgi:periplasmic copper chaperone A
MSLRHALTGVVVAALMLVLVAPMAAAHLTVDPAVAPEGGFATLTFRVPNEHDEASTTQVEVSLPTDTPIASVAVQPKPGWSYELERKPLDEPLDMGDGEEITEVVSKITWTGGRVAPGEFEQFGVALGPLPEDTDQITFPSVQSSDNGQFVVWAEEPTEHGREPEFPAPTLRLVEAGDDHGATGSDEEVAASGESGGMTVESSATQDDVDGAIVLGAIGVGVAVVALVTAGSVLVLLRRRNA